MELRIAAIAIAVFVTGSTVTVCATDVWPRWAVALLVVLNAVVAFDAALPAPLLEWRRKRRRL